MCLGVELEVRLVAFRGGGRGVVWVCLGMELEVWFVVCLGVELEVWFGCV